MSSLGRGHSVGCVSRDKGGSSSCHQSSLDGVIRDKSSSGHKSSSDGLIRDKSSSGSRNKSSSESLMRDRSGPQIERLHFTQLGFASSATEAFPVTMPGLSRSS